jgi:hypothetical protein
MIMLTILDVLIRTLMEVINSVFTIKGSPLLNIFMHGLHYTSLIISISAYRK